MHMRTTSIPLSTLYILCLVFDQVATDYAAVPRWGQAVALVNNVLFVHGGRTDQYNAYSYTSAPVNNDILFLSLESTFDPSSPPWQYVGGSSNSSSTQGPAVAWHTLSAFNNSELLLFGGVPGPNSPTVSFDQADSAYLLDIYNRIEPSWIPEAQSWANEPVRRMYLSASSSGGKIWLVGGEKADGSGSAFSDHYVFDPSGPSFTQLPTANGPSDIYGHASVVLSNGQLLVFGGYSPSASNLVPFSQIWALDTTQSALEWTSLSVDSSNLPTPRRGFAAVKLDGDEVLIHGGADATIQSTYSDGWILDPTKNPAVWSSVSFLSPLGARKDHFAVAVGSEVIFGFGYGSNGPVSAALQIFDLSSSAWQPSYTPIPTYTATTFPASTPTPTPTNGASGISGSTYSSGQTPSGSNTNSGGSSGTRTRSGYSGQPSPTSSSSGGGQTTDSDSTKSGAAAIALGTVFGFLALLACGTVTAYYVKHKRSQSRDAFHLIGGGEFEDEESAHGDGPGQLENLRMADRERSAGNSNVLTRWGVGVGLITRTAAERRDMLADEDTREFEGLASLYNRRRQPSSSTGSSHSGWVAERPKLGELLQGSWASLRSVGAMLGSGVRGKTSREASTSEKDPNWYEKGELLYEPFSETSLMRPHDPTPTRPRANREVSSTSLWSYVDPFADPEIDVLHDAGSDDGHEDVEETTLLTRPPHPNLRTAIPPSFGAHPLSPVTEQTSQHTLSTPGTSSQSSHEILSSPFDSLGTTSRSSHDASRPRLPRPTSIIDANPRPTEPLRRSDSWWARFSRTSFLDRRHSDGSRSRRGPLDFRDPQPPPRLLPIAESLKSPDSPDSPESKHRRRERSGNMTYSSHHARSMSSLQTTKTVDSEVLERMAANVDVIQRMGSHVTSPSSTSQSPGTDLTHSHSTPPVSSSARAATGHSTRSNSEATTSSPQSSAIGTTGHTARSASETSRSVSAIAATGHTTGSPSESSLAYPRSLSGVAALGYTGSPSEVWSIPSRSLSGVAATSHNNDARPIMGGNTVTSPDEMTEADVDQMRESPSSDSTTSTTRSPARSISGGNVASRIQAYERRLSQDLTTPPPTNTRQREERSRRGRPGVNYGLVPKPSLFVANPDHKSKGSSDS